MSLVERAIDKLRRNGAAVPGVPEDPVQQVVGTLTTGPAADVALDESGHNGPRIIINKDALRVAGYFPQADWDRVFSDQYRQIKRPLIAAAAMPDEPGAVAGQSRLIMMSSALPGDGKTFTSINLALSIARERDVSVVLVDADVAKPHISKIFGVEREPGLLDALADDQIRFESLILPTDIPGLSILPAGRQRESATELIASSRMAQIASRIVAGRPNAIVLFDSSPLVASSESRALAAVVGRVVLVVRAGKTPQQAVLDAVSYLGPTKPVALILNQARQTLVDGLYGYGRYGSYGTTSDPTE